MTVAPITTTRRRLPTTVLLEPRGDGVERRSAVLLENVMGIPAKTLERFVVRLRPERMREVEQAIRVAFALREATGYAEPPPRTPTGGPSDGTR